MLVVLQLLLYFLIFFSISNTAPDVKNRNLIYIDLERKPTTLSVLFSKVLSPHALFSSCLLLGIQSNYVNFNTNY